MSLEPRVLRAVALPWAMWSNSACMESGAYRQREIEVIPREREVRERQRKRERMFPGGIQAQILAVSQVQLHSTLPAVQLLCSSLSYMRYLDIFLTKPRF